LFLTESTNGLCDTRCNLIHTDCNNYHFTTQAVRCVSHVTCFWPRAATSVLFDTSCIFFASCYLLRIKSMVGLRDTSCNSWTGCNVFDTRSPKGFSTLAAAFATD
jgi:hypothetical protein